MGNKVTRIASPSHSPRVRQELWRMAKGRVERAIDEGFYLGAIALEESMMADRLESLLAHRGGPVEFDTVGRLGSQVRRHWSSPELNKLLDRVTLWSNRRAAAIHQMVKYGQGHEWSWRERIALAHETADEGRLLLLEVERIVRRVKRSSSEGHGHP